MVDTLNWSWNEIVTGFQTNVTMMEVIILFIRMKKTKKRELVSKINPRKAVIKSSRNELGRLVKNHLTVTIKD